MVWLGAAPSELKTFTWFACRQVVGVAARQSPSSAIAWRRLSTSWKAAVSRPGVVRSSKYLIVRRERIDGGGEGHVGAGDRRAAVEGAPPARVLVLLRGLVHDQVHVVDGELPVDGELVQDAVLQRLHAVLGAPQLADVAARPPPDRVVVPVGEPALRRVHDARHLVLGEEALPLLGAGADQREARIAAA